MSKPDSFPSPPPLSSYKSTDEKKKLAVFEDWARTGIRENFVIFSSVLHSTFLNTELHQTPF